MIHRRILSNVLILCLLCCATSMPLRGELTVIEDADGQQGLTVFRMTVTSAAEPVPALKHRLTLREIEMLPGNAATFYMRGFAESSLSSAWKAIVNQYGDEAHDWYNVDDISLLDLPLDNVRDAASRFDNLITYCIAPASKCRHCDWGLGVEELKGLEIYNILLPEFQESRQYSRMLSLLTRLAIAESRYDNAIDYTRMNYRLGYNTGRGPFLVCGLIGIAEVGMANRTLIDFVAAKDSPNLYWALAELPKPIVDIRRAVRIEMSLIPRVIRDLERAGSEEHAADEWSRFLHRAFHDFQKVTEAWNGDGILPKHATWREIAGTGITAIVYPQAKLRMLQSGMSAEDVEEMPVGQVVLIDTARGFQRIADQMEKWFYVDYPLARDRLGKSVGALQREDMLAGLGQTLADLLLPAIQVVHTANARMQWQVNALQAIEALRMHAAETGQFPASLDEVEIVPVPKNPITEQSYQYRLDDDTAVLELPFSDGMPGVAWRFEIRLADEN